uniref:Uncharacterized protein n=1 Tax=Arundo donax TaxID=35708 RepID=A0A0A9EV48_ARUDO
MICMCLIWIISSGRKSSLALVACGQVQEADFSLLSTKIRYICMVGILKKFLLTKKKEQFMRICGLLILVLGSGIRLRRLGCRLVPELGFQCVFIKKGLFFLVVWSIWKLKVMSL